MPIITKPVTAIAVINTLKFTAPPDWLAALSSLDIIHSVMTPKAASAAVGQREPKRDSAQAMMQPPQTPARLKMIEPCTATDSERPNELKMTGDQLKKVKIINMLV